MVLFSLFCFIIGCDKIKGISENGSGHKTGEIVINPQFDYAGCFSEGLAVIRVGDQNTGKFGFIDKTGQMVIKPQFLMQ